MPKGMDSFGRIVAALVALALLVLPVAPMSHASAASAVTAQDAVHHCLTEADAAAGTAVAAHAHDHGQPARHSGDAHKLAWCTSAQCPATVAVAPVLPGQPPVPSSLRLVSVAIPVVSDGIAVAPALQPPRALA